MIKVAPSILSADFSRLGQEISAVEKAGADLLHIDVMDGHFVRNITIGPLVVKAARKSTSLTLDTHLMIENPERYVEAFIKAGSGIISFHIETTPDPLKLIKMIEDLGAAPALAINPDTPAQAIERFLDKVKMVLVMTVFPGFEGQKFIPDALKSVRAIRETANKRELGLDIEVDGGINPQTAKEAVDAGANILVAGSAVFYSKDYGTAISRIRTAK
ncbi:MAG: ribulose-phosphate 3-epimerase [Candidatus Margulisiibacteriota bacterium]